MRPSIMSLGATMSAPRLGEHGGVVGEDVDGVVVGDVAVGVEHAVMAVAGVGIERDVGDEKRFGRGLLDLADGGEEPVLGNGGVLAAGVLEAGVDLGKERDGLDAERGEFLHLGDGVAQVEARLSGQRGGSSSGRPLPSLRKSGWMRSSTRNLVLAHERADGGALAGCGAGGG